MKTCKLDVVAVAVAIAVTWGIAVFFVGVIAGFSLWGRPFVTAIGSLYIGYTPGIPGSIIGLIWAVIDGAIGGAFYAWIYNWVAVRRYRGAVE